MIAAPLDRAFAPPRLIGSTRSVAAARRNDGDLRAIRSAPRGLVSTGPGLQGRVRLAGEATAEADVVEVRYIDIVPDARVVQAVDFVSDDPAFAGTMTMIWEVTALDGGTRVDITGRGCPGTESPRRIT